MRFLCPTRVCRALRSHYARDTRHSAMARLYEWNGREWTPLSACDAAAASHADSGTEEEASAAADVTYYGRRAPP